MRRFMFRFSIIVVLCTWGATLAVADEGMWLLTALDKLPLHLLKSRGLKLTPLEIYNQKGPSLKDAIVLLGGGTGEFVSPDGLMLTNHHVAYGSLQSNSTPEKDYIKLGFHAQKREEELPAKGYTAQIVEEMRDVTMDVLAMVKTGMAGAERDTVVKRKSDELIRAATGGNKDLRATVQEMNGGQQYVLFLYRVIRDVRLVYSPPLSIGNYGGEVDNWMWPRHTGDFSFMRAYVGVDGTGAEYAKENVPFKPKAFLKISVKGTAPGAFVMIMGFPGRTFRYRSSYEVRYDQNVNFPTYIRMVKANIDALETAQKRDKATELKYASRVKGLYNGYKNRKGMVEGFKRLKLAALKEKEEKEFTEWLAKDPIRAKKYGDILPGLKKVYAELGDLGVKQISNTYILRAGTLVTQALAIAKWRAEQRKPDAQRDEGFRSKDSGQVRTRLMQKVEDPELDEMLFSNVLAAAGAHLIPERLATLFSISEKKEGPALQLQLRQAAGRMLSETRLGEPEERLRALSMPEAEFTGDADPLLAFARTLVEESEQFLPRYNELMRAVDAYRSRYIEALSAWKNAYLYPDANRTLRFTHGVVKAYEPRDAMSYAPVTSLHGIIEKDTGEEPFDAPIQLTYLSEKKDFGPYADKKLGDVPVAFLSNTDITGGNSGSPVLNGRGELVGCAFDGVYEGLLNDYRYDESYSRTISVESRYILFILDKFSNAQNLLKELTIVR